MGTGGFDADVGDWQPTVFEYSALSLPSFTQVSILWTGSALGLYRGSEEAERTPSPASPPGFANFQRALKRLTGGWTND
jgi:hypothetical protein